MLFVDNTYNMALAARSHAQLSIVIFLHCYLSIRLRSHLCIVLLNKCTERRVDETYTNPRLDASPTAWFVRGLTQKMILLDCVLPSGFRPQIILIMTLGVPVATLRTLGWGDLPIEYERMGSVCFSL